MLARIYESFPLVCTNCGKPMRIIAFITDSRTVVRILGHIDELAVPPAVSPCRDPPEWGDNVETSCLDPLAQHEPEYDFDQSAGW